MMEKHFCNYEQALALKELGFEELCFAYYSINNIENKLFYDIDPDDGELTALNQNQFYHNNLSEVGRISAPLKSQVLQWFREKQNILGSVDFCKRNKWYYVIRNIVSLKDTLIDSVSEGDYKFYEEAESACINKLIDLVKNK